MLKLTLYSEDAPVVQVDAGIVTVRNLIRTMLHSSITDGEFAVFPTEDAETGLIGIALFPVPEEEKEEVVCRECGTPEIACTVCGKRYEG